MKHTDNANSKSKRRPRWLNGTVLGIGLASLFSDWSHDIAITVMQAFLATMGVARRGSGAGCARRFARCSWRGRRRRRYTGALRAVDSGGFAHQPPHSSPEPDRERPDRLRNHQPDRLLAAQLGARRSRSFIGGTGVDIRIAKTACAVKRPEGRAPATATRASPPRISRRWRWWTFNAKTPRRQGAEPLRTRAIVSRLRAFAPLRFTSAA